VSFDSRRLFDDRSGSSSSSSATRFLRLRERDSPDLDAGGDVASSIFMSSSTLDAAGKREVYVYAASREFIVDLFFGEGLRSLEVVSSVAGGDIDSPFMEPC
jgi:hypothetical protein